MREEIGERGSKTHSERFFVIFLGFEGILTVGAKETIKNHPDPSRQTFKKPKKSSQKASPGGCTFFVLPSTVWLANCVNLVRVVVFRRIVDDVLMFREIV